MTWRNILVLGAVASAAVVGCTVTATVGPGDASPDGAGATTETGGKAGSAGSGGSSGSTGGSKTGGTGGGGKAGSGGKMDSGIPDAHFDVCNPDKTKMCDNCVQTKCCDEWLACANDTDCLKTVGGKDPEFTCIQDCLIGDGGSFATVEDCAGLCQHESAGVSIATSELIACMRAKMDDAGPQNCTQECFNRDLPVK